MTARKDEVGDTRSMLVASYEGPHTFTAGATKRMWRMLEEQLSQSEEASAGRSASGWSASIAVNICATKGWPYQLTAYPGLGYEVKRIKPL